LTTESEQEAKALAEELEQLNRARRDIENDMLQEAVAQVESRELPGGIVLASRWWHLGVVGIVAARIMERFHRPTIVIAIGENGIGKGSARTVPGFDLYQALAGCRDVLVAFGGHPSAAGVTIQEGRLPEFVERFSAIAGTWMSEERAVPTLHVDSEVRLKDVTMQLIQEIGALHPFGAGNPEPTFAVKRLNILNARVVGEKHLKMTVRQDGSLPFDSIGFGMKSLEDHGLSLNMPIDVAFTPEVNHWNGYDRIQLRIRDIRPAGE
jgi:single-stranded-DNA-specific exonuclease